VQYVGGYESEIDYLLMGRAIDMIRVMRFFQIFRDVIRRSADVLPAMRGPIVLVVTIVHVFVYLGIGLWGGAIDVESLAQNKSITPLYYLNNFNSYAEGLVTMFNVLVVNDWHAVAEVFLYADRCSSPYFVYPFFICAICTGVFIMLNVITAFFVEGESHGARLQKTELDFSNLCFVFLSSLCDEVRRRWQ
jgi:two pore calcium channel protein